MDAVRKQKMMVQPNSITEAHYSLSLYEKQIMLMALGELNTNLVQVEGEEIHIDLDELHERTRSTTRKDKFRERFKKSLVNLINSHLYVKIGSEHRYINWLSEARFDDNHQKIVIVLGKTVAKLFSEIRGNYTQYALLNAFLLDSNHAIRLYELALQYKPSFKEIPLISYEELKARLGLSDKYKTFNDFKKWVLEPCIKDINSKTDIRLSYTTRRTGRYVSHIQFSYYFITRELELSYKTSSDNHYTNKIKTKLVKNQQSEVRQRASNYFTTAPTVRSVNDALLEKRMKELEQKNG